MRVQKTGMRHRMLALLLVVVLLVGCLPGVVFAQAPDSGDSAAGTGTTQNVPQGAGPEVVPLLTYPVSLTVTVDNATVTVVDDTGSPVEGADQVYTVEKGAVLAVTIDPVGNGYVSEVTVDRENQEELPVKGDAYTVEVTMDANKDISATIAQRYQVSVTNNVAEAGSVTLNAQPYTEPVLVDENTNVEVRISANEGYHIQSVFFGNDEQNVSNSAQFTGTITGIAADTVISVTFVKVYTVPPLGSVITVPPSV